VSDVRTSLYGWNSGGSLPGGHTSINAACIRERHRVWDGSVSGRGKATPHMKSFFRFDAQACRHADIQARCFTRACIQARRHSGTHRHAVSHTCMHSGTLAQERARTHTHESDGWVHLVQRTRDRGH
jgi:hypothetical protein